MEASTTQSLEVGAQPMDCVFHPEQSLVAAGLVNGQLRVYDCSGAEPSQSLSLKAHKDSCRTVAFAKEGSALVTGSVDLSILVYDLATEKALARLSDAHDAAVNRLLTVSEWAFASGDDNGIIKTWDMRQKKATAQFSAHTDYITDLSLHSGEECLLAVSGDGTLSVNDLRKNKLTARSEDDADDELEAVVVLKHGKKVVCGMQSGVLNIFSWGQFADCSDRCPGHPASVEAMLKLDEDTVITGAGDGVIRVLAIQPHRLVGVLGEQEDGGCDRLALSADRRLLASTSYGTTLQLWDSSCLNEDGDAADGEEAVDEEAPAGKVDPSSDEEEEEGEQQRKRRRKQKEGRTKTKIKSGKHSAAFFKDIL